MSTAVLSQSPTSPDQRDLSRLSVDVNAPPSSSPFPSPSSTFFPPPIQNPNEYANKLVIPRKKKQSIRADPASTTSSAADAPMPTSAPGPTASTPLSTNSPAQGLTSPTSTPTPSASTPRPMPPHDSTTPTPTSGADMPRPTPTCMSPAPAPAPSASPPGPTMPTPTSNSARTPTATPAPAPITPSSTTFSTSSTPGAPISISTSSITTTSTLAAPSTPTLATPTSPDVSKRDSLRDSLVAQRAAPASPGPSRRSSAQLTRSAFALSRTSSLSRPTLSRTSSLSKPPASPAPKRASKPSPSWPAVTIRDFAFPAADERYAGRGAAVPKENARLLRGARPFSQLSMDDESEDDESDGEGELGGGWTLGAAFQARARMFETFETCELGVDDVRPTREDLARSFEFMEGGYGNEEDDDRYGDYEEVTSDEDDDDFKGGVWRGAGESWEELVPGLYRAAYAFTPEGTAEMALAEDQEVRVVGRGDGVGWAIAVRPDGKGHALVPEGYLELIKADEEG